YLKSIVLEKVVLRETTLQEELQIYKKLEEELNKKVELAKKEQKVY
ncbi:1103_t:CDS:1, partial [Gigaspora margarita]